MGVNSKEMLRVFFFQACQCHPETQIKLFFAELQGGGQHVARIQSATLYNVQLVFFLPLSFFILFVSAPLSVYYCV